MSEVIEVPGITKLLDTEGGRSEVRRIYQPQLNLIGEITEYGANLLLRAFATTTTRTVADVVVLPVLFRQVVAMLDAARLCLEGAAVYASFVPTRALWEATLSLEWILKNGKDYWGRQYYVSHLRKRRSWARQSIPGTPDHKRYRQAVSSVRQLATPIQHHRSS